ncbi:phasin family protein [Methylobacterium sp. EM32]|uniref:phasin family protein n=1 Tax=Methylobacterium sp. EM32 TaxID=3163481 RepID=UPI0033BCF95A
MTTTRRTDRTRKPPRRPPVRTAARMDDPAKTSEPTVSEMTASETTSDEAMMDEIAEIETSADMDQAEAEQPGTDPTAEDGPAEAAEPEQAPETPIEAPAAEAVDEVKNDGDTVDEASPASSIEEPAEEPAAETPAADIVATEPGPATAQDPDIQDPAPVASEAPVAGPVADEAPTATAEAPEAAPEQPGPKGQDEVPLAAMQGFIEINGRLVAFLQGESQAALAFWKAALTVRTPGDLAQLQAAEMTRAVDAAFACWQDLARRMERLPAFKAPRARAA